MNAVPSAISSEDIHFLPPLQSQTRHELINFIVEAMQIPSFHVKHNGTAFGYDALCLFKCNGMAFRIAVICRK
jgi:hypothetical protein